jgi:hypothetical protein
MVNISNKGKPRAVQSKMLNSLVPRFVSIRQDSTPPICSFLSEFGAEHAW